MEADCGGKGQCLVFGIVGSFCVVLGSFLIGADCSNVSSVMCEILLCLEVGMLGIFCSL